jgi:hypothetical protein
MNIYRHYALPFFAALLLVMTGPQVRATEMTTPLTHGPSPEVLAFQHSPTLEIYRLRIVNAVNGEISGSRDGGKSWQPLGHVLSPSTKVTLQGYTASKWAQFSAVSATAVNAIHIRTGYNAKDDKGVVFSILPKEMTTEEGQKYQSFSSPDAMTTDIPAGTGIFGGHWAPILGNPIALEQHGQLLPLPMQYVPQTGDIYVIRVLEARNSPKAIDFENRFGGFITLIGWDDSEMVIGQVLKPVEGVGRFWGGQYAGVGRLRANHNGVIDVSASPTGMVGGIQILPRVHAMSPEMTRARTMTQWMVVGPLDARDPSWEGVSPLFLGYLRPSWAADDLTAPNWRALLADRTLVQVRIKNGPWQPMPTFSMDPDMSKPLPEWSNTALEDMTNLRILLPVPAQQ